MLHNNISDCYFTAERILVYHPVDLLLLKEKSDGFLQSIMYTLVNKSLVLQTVPIISHYPSERNLLVYQNCADVPSSLVSFIY